MVKKGLTLQSDTEAKLLCGPHDENLRLVEKELEVSIFGRGHTVIVEGSKEKVEDVK